MGGMKCIFGILIVKPEWKGQFGTKALIGG
jgi:hypothetical protein